ncbi:MAG TPA: CoA ester lyase [Thermoanaerobaculia bacterium]|nr:CoA ester lyase [Thermoanaerobaculia bacterium]
MIRSLFFAPANRPDLIAKFPRFPADCYVIDLEDGTPPAEKATARSTIGDSVAKLRAAGLRGLLTIRVNEPASEHYLADLQAAWASDADGVVIPKLEEIAQLFPAVHGATQADRVRPHGDPRCIVAGIESIGGVVNATAICGGDSRVTAVYFGAEDFISEMGGRRTPRGKEVLYARSQVVIAAKLARITALDQAVTEIRDDTQFREDAALGRDLGYDGKICVLPRQVAIANELFSPTAEEVTYCRRLIETYERATAAGIGTIDFEGRMIDGPLLKRAQRVVSLAERIEGTHGTR